jgi:hypothetical protein
MQSRWRIRLSRIALLLWDYASSEGVDEGDSDRRVTGWRPVNAKVRAPTKVAPIAGITLAPSLCNLIDIVRALSRVAAVAGSSCGARTQQKSEGAVDGGRTCRDQSSALGLYSKVRALSRVAAVAGRSCGARTRQQSEGAVEGSHTCRDLSSTLGLFMQSEGAVEGGRTCRDPSSALGLEKRLSFLTWLLWART